MAATQADRHLDEAPIFQSGTSSHNAVTINRVCNCVEHYWQLARLATGITKIPSNVRMALYRPANF
ncbi:hypothetical protein BGZ81_010634, partial [Podila clonocystis]